ncbi:unnamed protein product [Alopecurus aequalis]
MASRRCRIHTSPALGPLEDDDLLGDIFLRLPLKPSSLPRASLVCKRWPSAAASAPTTGSHPSSGYSRRIATGNSNSCLSLDLSADRFDSWTVLGCRHGRVLLINWERHLLLVFEPVSGDTLRIPIPPEFSTANAAVLCAAGDDQDHVHGDCHSSPFKVFLVGDRRHQAGALVYSSQAGVWGDFVSTTEPCTGGISCTRSTLVGNVLYWFLIGSIVGIFQFDLDKESLTVIDGPPAGAVRRQLPIIRAEDGGLGLAILSYPSFQLWGRKVDSHGVATWVPRKKVNMDKMLGPMETSAHILGYAEDADAIFMSMCEALDSGTSGHVFVTVHLESMKVEKYRGSFYRNYYHLFTNFYTAGNCFSLHYRSNINLLIIQM